MEAKILLIVLPPAGLNIWDTPRPQSQGALLRRAVAKGTPLYAYRIVNFQGVPYAWLQPQDPNKPEWVRVAEADGVTKYVEIIQSEVEPAPNQLAQAIRYAADKLADAIRFSG